jgi:hypothetical protein
MCLLVLHTELWLRTLVLQINVVDAAVCLVLGG